VTKDVADNDKGLAKELSKRLSETVEYAPWRVRILSALCLRIGTMIGYRRIVTTLGERLGNIHASARSIGRVGFRRLDRHLRLYWTSRKHDTLRHLRDRRNDGQFRRWITVRNAFENCHRLACDFDCYVWHCFRSVFFPGKPYDVIDVPLGQRIYSANNRGLPKRLGRLDVRWP
jgi:hypothetical protein